MKLIYHPYDLKCELFEEKINSIVIESSNIYEQFIIDLDNQINKLDHNFYFEKNDSEIQVNKNIVLITSPLDLIVNKKVFQKELIKRIIEEIHISSVSESLSKVYANLIEQLGIVLASSEFDIEFNEEITDESIFKMVDIEIKQPEGTFVEKLLDYIKIEQELLNKTIFIVANCSAFINDKIYEELLKISKYQGFCLVFVDNKQIIKCDNLNEYILDHDICEIH